MLAEGKIGGVQAADRPTRRCLCKNERSARRPPSQEGHTPPTGRPQAPVSQKHMRGRWPSLLAKAPGTCGGATAARAAEQLAARLAKRGGGWVVPIYGPLRRRTNRYQASVGPTRTGSAAVNRSNLNILPIRHHERAQAQCAAVNILGHEKKAAPNRISGHWLSKSKAGNSDGRACATARRASTP